MKAFLFAVLVLSSPVSIFAKDHSSLDFFIIYEKPFKNAEVVSVFALNLNGYRNSSPDLKITHLKSADLNSQLGEWTMMNSDRTIKEKGHEMDYNVTVVLEDQDDPKLTTFSERATGQRVLLQIDATPLMAPMLHSKLEKSFQITLHDKKKAEDLLARLLPLVDLKKADQGDAVNH
jgi:hypothetical protein